jgi:predicted membrane protein
MDYDADKFRQNLEDRIKSRIHAGIGERNRYQGLIPGAVILAIGAIFLLNNFGYLNAGRIWDFWPVILIFVGVVKMLDPCRRFWGGLLTLFGTILLLNQLGIAHISWNQLWPLVLIGVGSMAMWSALRARRMTDGLKSPNSDPRNSLNESAVFGGVEKRLNTKEFRGGQLQSMFGGIEIDLRDADIDGTEAVLHANAIFGGIELRVPETWFVASHGQGIFGGYSDSTRYHPPVDPDKPKKTLVVVGTAVFGGVEIRN